MGDYEILHLKPGASFAEIQQAHRDLVRVWHPDRFSADPRLQKIANEKLSEINHAYLVLADSVRRATPQAHPWPPAAPTVRRATTLLRTFHRRYAPARNMARSEREMLGLWFLLTLVLIGIAVTQLYAFFETPKRALQAITADAYRIAASNGPSVENAFQGWNGFLPQGLDRLLALYQSTPVAGGRHVEVSRVPAVAASHPRVTYTQTSTPALVHGVGEIRVQNRTSEAVLLSLKGTRIRAAGRRIAVPAQGDVTLGDLGPDLYMVDVSFPGRQRPPMRLGPFVMVEIESAASTSGDQYEIILKP